jgi:hypothetical protein
MEKNYMLFGWNKYTPLSISLKRAVKQLSISTHFEKQKAKSRI